MYICVERAGARSVVRMVERMVGRPKGNKTRYPYALRSPVRVDTPGHTLRAKRGGGYILIYIYIYRGGLYNYIYISISGGSPHWLGT